MDTHTSPLPSGALGSAENPTTPFDALKARLDSLLAGAAYPKRNGKFDPRIQILFVEDSHFIHQTVSLLLNDPHYRLRFASNAENAVQAYIEKPPHMVFVDIGLPGLSGLDVMGLITKHDPQAYAVVLSGSTETAHITKARDNIAKGYIPNAFNRQQLVAAIQRYRETF